MKGVEGWVTVVLYGALLLLIITHAGGFSTDVLAGGKVLNNTVSTLSGAGRNAGVNYPTGTISPSLAA